MSRINTNVPSLIAQRILSMQNSRLQVSLERLSTGLRINKGKDDPAGLIASERMRAEMRALQAAQSNVSRAKNVMAVTESGLTEISNMLNDIEELIDRSSNEAGITDDELRANQAEIDMLLESINRIASSAELQGRKLLNGDLAYTTSGVLTSQIADVQINSARIPGDGYRAVSITVTSTASLAVLGYIGSTITTSARTIEITGNLGSERLTFGVGTTVDQMVSAINAARDVTGVSATASAGDLRFNSIEYGSDQFVRVRLLAGSSFQMVGDLTEDYGADVSATVNGMTAVGSGLKVSIRTESLNADFILTEGFATQTAVSANMYITGGGANFIIGPEINNDALATIGIDSVSTTSLGNDSVGFLYTLATGEENSLDSGNFAVAQRILREVTSQIASLRGRIGSFEKNILEPAYNSLAIQFENVAAAESAIRDTDFAEQTSQMTRAQILVQAATNVLQMANQAPLNVLALLNG